MLSDNSKMLVRTKHHLPSSRFGFNVVTLSFESIFITVHLRVLHSTPYLPNFSNAPGTSGNSARIHAKAIISLDKVRNPLFEIAEL